MSLLLPNIASIDSIAAIIRNNTEYCNVLRLARKPRRHGTRGPTAHPGRNLRPSPIDHSVDAVFMGSRGCDTPPSHAQNSAIFSATTAAAISGESEPHQVSSRPGSPTRRHTRGLRCCSTPLPSPVACGERINHPIQSRNENQTSVATASDILACTVH